jgi:hypothetical protein
MKLVGRSNEFKNYVALDDRTKNTARIGLNRFGV